MKRIAYTDNSGNCCIVIPSISRDDPATFSEDDALQRAMKDIPADASSVTVLDASDLPARDFRNAWELQNGSVVHNMDKAREIQKDNLRSQRAPLLATLDLEYQRADEDGDIKAKAVIAAQKKVLRDITERPEIAAAQSPEELEAFMPFGVDARI